MTDVPGPDLPRPGDTPGNDEWTPAPDAVPMPPAPPPGYQAPGYQAPGYQQPTYQTPGYPPPTGYPSTPFPPGGPTAPVPPGSGAGGLLAGIGGQANMLGVLSSVAGLLSVLCCGCAAFGGGGAYFSTLILAVPAVVLGILHIRKVKAGQATNQSLAMIGIGLGVLGLIIAVCFGVSSVGTDFHNDVR